MSVKHYADLDLMKNKIEQARLDTLFDDPQLSELQGQEGRIWYNMTEDVFKYYDGREVKIIENKNYLTADDIDVIWELARQS